MEDEKKSSLIHLIVGGIAGAISYTLNSVTYSILVALIIGFLLGKNLEKYTEEKSFKWWVGNGLIIYFFIWIVSWIFLFNL